MQLVALQLSGRVVHGTQQSLKHTSCVWSGRDRNLTLSVQLTCHGLPVLFTILGYG